MLFSNRVLATNEIRKQHKKGGNSMKKVMAFVIALLLFLEQTGWAQMVSPVHAGAVAPQVAGMEKFRPIHLRSLLLERNTSKVTLLVDPGDNSKVEVAQVKAASAKLVEYFQVGLRLPNSMFWVNLRPDLRTDSIDPYIERTDLGRVLLEADVRLKKDMGFFSSPNTQEGREYWNRLYAKAEELFGRQSADIPTFARPWIVPGEVVIKQSWNGVYVYKATLKVVLEQDYLKDASAQKAPDPRVNALNEYSASLMRTLILPKLIRSINSSRRYAELRQVYYSLILAQWVKHTVAKNNDMRNGLSKEILANLETKDLSGLTSTKKWSKDEYFNEYCRSFKNGEYDCQEAYRGKYGRMIRRYFSGGVAPTIGVATKVVTVDGINNPVDGNLAVTVDLKDPDAVIVNGASEHIQNGQNESDGDTKSLYPLYRDLLDMNRVYTADDLVAIVSDHAISWVERMAAVERLGRSPPQERIDPKFLIAVLHESDAAPELQRKTIITLGKLLEKNNTRDKNDIVNEFRRIVGPSFLGDESYKIFALWGMFNSKTRDDDVLNSARELLQDKTKSINVRQAAAWYFSVTADNAAIEKMSDNLANENEYKKYEMELKGVEFDINPVRNELAPLMYAKYFAVSEEEKEVLESRKADLIQKFQPLEAKRKQINAEMERLSNERLLDNILLWGQKTRGLQSVNVNEYDVPQFNPLSQSDIVPATETNPKFEHKLKTTQQKDNMKGASVEDKFGALSNKWADFIVNDATIQAKEAKINQPMFTQDKLVAALEQAKSNFTNISDALNQGQLTMKQLRDDAVVMDVNIAAGWDLRVRVAYGYGEDPLVELTITATEQQKPLPTYYLKNVSDSLMGATFVSKFVYFLHKMRVQLNGMAVPIMGDPAFVRLTNDDNEELYYGLEKRIEVAGGQAYHNIPRFWEEKEHFRMLGEQVAVNHSLANDFINDSDNVDVIKHEYLSVDVGKDPWVELNDKLDKVLRKNLADLTSADRTLLEHYGFMQERLVESQKFLNSSIYRRMYWVVAHTDFGLHNNVVVNAARDLILGCFDFNKSRISPRLEDMKNPILVWPGPGRVYNPIDAIAFLKGYQRKAVELGIPLTPIEIRGMLGLIDQTFLWADQGAMTYPESKYNTERFNFAMYNHYFFTADIGNFASQLRTLPQNSEWQVKLPKMPEAFTKIATEYWIPLMKSFYGKYIQSKAKADGDAFRDAVRVLGVLGVPEGKKAIDQLNTKGLNEEDSKIIERAKEWIDEANAVESGASLVTKVKESGEQTVQGKDLGGIDLRALPVCEQGIGVSPAVSLPVVPAFSSIQEMTTQWLDIEQKSMEVSRSFGALKQFVARCRRTSGAEEQLAKVKRYVADILKEEEEAVVSTSQDLREVLAFLG